MLTVKISKEEKDFSISCSKFHVYIGLWRILLKNWYTGNRLPYLDQTTAKEYKYYGILDL